eukprot:evm.model.scf_565.5 EVM.evm.TU.scf_565.5   scf_565:12776-26338(-)
MDAHRSHRPKAYVRCIPGEENLQIMITLAGRERNMNRPKSELLERSLARIRISLTAKPDKKRRKKNADVAAEEPYIPVELYETSSSSKPIDLQVSNEAGWTKAGALLAGQQMFDVEVNPPTVDKISLHTTPMIGYPLLPNYVLQFADSEACEWQWFRRHKDGQDWQAIDCQSRVYTPKAEDKGCSVRVQCTPRAFSSHNDSKANGIGGSVRVGMPVAADTGPVDEGPPEVPGQGRHLHTNEVLRSPLFRVVTYNILADQYVSMNDTQELLFNYCDKKYLSLDYRKQLVLEELEGYNADIICLQEIDEKAFRSYFQPHFADRGFEGYYANKVTAVREGCATFFRSSRFEVLRQKDVSLRDQFAGPLAPHLRCFEPMMSSSLQKCFQKIGTIAQMLVLAPRGGCRAEGCLCVVNTHLFFHPRAPHIRSMQAACIMHEAHALMTSAASGSTAPEPISVVFCGDLNSAMHSGRPGAVELLQQGRLRADYWDWKDGALFKWDKSEEGCQLEGSKLEDDMEVEDNGSNEMTDGKAVYGVDVAIPFKLRSADGLETPFTNYVRHYCALLDYIWYDPRHLRVERGVPMPSERELRSFLPSRRFPSDHLAVVFDLAWRSDRELVDDRHDVDQSPPASATTNVVPADLNNVDLAVEALRRSRVIGVPTDTIYGFAADASKGDAIQRVYRIKQRSRNVPLAVCLADVDQIGQCCRLDHLPPSLVGDLLPGPLTLVLPRLPDATLSPQLNPELPNLAVRVPDHEFMREVCRRFDGPVALTSANRSGEPSSRSAEEFRDLWPLCEAVFDGGVSGESGAGSTLLDLSAPGRLKILREGAGMREALLVLEKYGLRPGP